MRSGTGFLAMVLAVLAIGGAHASGAGAGAGKTLRISLTVVDRCDIRQAAHAPSVDCSAGVPWTLATAGSATAGESRPVLPRLPVPDDVPAGAGQVTLVVF